MNKKALKWTIIVLVVVIVMCAIQILRGRLLLPFQVQRVELRGHDSCETPASQYVELNRKEVWEFLLYYNFSFFAGLVDGESCDSDYGFKLHLTNGEVINIREANLKGSTMAEVSPVEGEKYWIHSKVLESYAQKLLKQYGAAEE